MPVHLTTKVRSVLSHLVTRLRMMTAQIIGRFTSIGSPGYTLHRRPISWLLAMEAMVMVRLPRQGVRMVSSQ